MPPFNKNSEADMKLYLKLDLPVKEVGYRDHRNRVVKGFFVKPDEPTEIPDHHAKKILEQNPHLVDTKPLKKSAKKDNSGEKGQLAEVVKTVPMASNEDEKILKKLHTVKNIANAGDLKELPTKQIREYGRKLGIKIPSNISADKQIAMLEAECKKIVEEYSDTIQRTDE